MSLPWQVPQEGTVLTPPRQGDPQSLLHCQQSPHLVQGLCGPTWPARSPSYHLDYFLKNHHTHDVNRLHSPGYDVALGSFCDALFSLKDPRA